MHNPMSPAEILKEDYMEPLKMNSDELANHIGITTREARQLVKGDLEITEHIAIELSYLFNTTPGFWMNLQKQYKEYHG